MEETGDVKLHCLSPQRDSSRAVELCPPRAGRRFLFPRAEELGRRGPRGGSAARPPPPSRALGTGLSAREGRGCAGSRPPRHMASAVALKAASAGTRPPSPFAASGVGREDDLGRELVRRLVQRLVQRDLLAGEGVEQQGPRGRRGVARDEGEPPVARGADAAAARRGAEDPAARAACVREPGPAPGVEGAGRERDRVARGVVGREHGEGARDRRRERGAPRGADGAAGG